MVGKSVVLVWGTPEEISISVADSSPIVADRSPRLGSSEMSPTAGGAVSAGSSSSSLSNNKSI